MKKSLVLLFAIVLGLTGCTMNVPTNVAPQVELSQDKIEWISSGNRAATTLDEVTVEVYKVPNINGKFIQDEKELLYTKALHRGETLYVPSTKDYNYKYVTCIRVIEFNNYNLFCTEKNEIYIFDYENTVGMEVSINWGSELKTKNPEGHKVWRKNSKYKFVIYRDDIEGYEDYYYFLDDNTLAKFYNEHKDGGRIVWNN